MYDEDRLRKMLIAAVDILVKDSGPQIHAMLTNYTMPVGPKLVIKHCTYSECPRDYESNIGTMACWHRKRNLGDVQPKESPSDWLASLPDKAVVLPVYGYEHGGLVISTSPFNDRFDSGLLGYIYANPALYAELGWAKMTKARIAKAREYLKQEVALYNSWLNDEVWTCTVTDETGVVHEDTQIGSSVLDQFNQELPEQYAHLLFAAWEKRFE